MATTVKRFRLRADGRHEPVRSDRTRRFNSEGKLEIDPDIVAVTVKYDSLARMMAGKLHAAASRIERANPPKDFYGSGIPRAKLR